MAAGLAERERLRDLFGRHVGTSVAQRALRRRRLAGRGAAHGRGAVRRHRRVDLAGPAHRAGGDGRPAQPLLRGRRRHGRGRGRAGQQVRGRRRAVRLRRARPTTRTRPGRRCGPRAASATPSPRPGRSTSGSGVACGRVWAGQVGAASRLEYTVIGDPVNEAARLTELAKEHRGPRRRQRARRCRLPRRASGSTGSATPRWSSAAAARRPRPGCANSLVEWTCAVTARDLSATGQWWERTTTRTSSDCRVPISGSSKSSVRPPRVTDSTMSRSDAGVEADLAGGDRCAGAGPGPGRR